MLMATTNIFAETFTLNGLNYRTTSSGTVKIISVENKDELFSVIIPSTVAYNSKDYRVTKIENNVIHNIFNFGTAWLILFIPVEKCNLVINAIF